MQNMYGQTEYMNLCFGRLRCKQDLHGMCEITKRKKEILTRTHSHRQTDRQSYKCTSTHNTIQYNARTEHPKKDGLLHIEKKFLLTAHCIGISDNRLHYLLLVCMCVCVCERVIFAIGSLFVLRLVPKSLNFCACFLIPLHDCSLSFLSLVPFSFCTVGIRSIIINISWQKKICKKLFFLLHPLISGSFSYTIM